MGKLKKYKLKTHKSTAKRFRHSGSGKLLRTRGPSSHFKRNRDQTVINDLGDMAVVTDEATRIRIQRLAPYLGKYDSRPSRPGSRGKGKRGKTGGGK